MNILVTSAGRRVKIIEYFKNTLKPINGKVIATDCDSHAPAIYFADNYEIVPRIDDPNYINILLEICKKYEINGIVSLIDPELEILAQMKKEFEEISVKLILSPLEAVKITFDKYKTYRYLNEKGIPAVPTYNNINEVIELVENKVLTFPLVVKPAKGSASIGINTVSNINELTEAYSNHTDQIIQPFYKDKEFGIDVYIDMINGRLVNLFIKEKVRMRAGETDKSISIHNDKIEKIVKEMILKTDFLGPIDIDCFEYNGEYYISEINPRFGGGYPHAYELGCNFMKYILNNLNRKVNKNYNTYTYEPDFAMMKYDNVLIQKNNEQTSSILKSDKE